jgi:DUF4097 and DUF4098 domain-containing protein YvlB
VRISVRGPVIDIGPAGPPADIDYRIDAPAWAGVRLEGVSCDADIQGLGGPVAVNTVEGTVEIRQVSGSVDVTTVDGDVTVDGGQGLHLHSVDGSVVVSNARGEVNAASVDGDVRLSGMNASSVDASSVDGDISFSGRLGAQGRYRFSTHDGDVTLVLPADTSASIETRSLFSRATIESDLPLTLAPSTGNRRRQVFTLGSGSADVTLETYDGAVRIRQLGD